MGLLMAPVFSVVLARGIDLMAEQHWSALRKVYFGVHFYGDIAPLLAASLSLLAAIVGLPARTGRLGPPVVAALCASPLLVAIVVLGQGARLITEDFQFLGPLSTVPGILARSAGLYNTVVALASCVPGPLLVLAWTWRERWTAALAAAGSGYVLALIAYAGQRAEHLRTALAMSSDGRWDFVEVASWPGLPMGIVAAAVGLGFAGWLAWERRWLAAAFWAPVGVCLVDPGAVIMDAMLMPVEPEVPSRLPLIQASALQGRGILLDWTGERLVLNGEAISPATLGGALRALGFLQVGSRRATYPQQGWLTFPRERVLVALNGERQWAELKPIFADLQEHGIGFGLLVGQPGDARNRSWPVLPLILDEPGYAPDLLPTVGAAVELGPEVARVISPEGRCDGQFPLPAGLSALAAAVAPCRQGLVLMPTDELRFSDFFLALDRLGGSAERAPFRQALGLSLLGPDQLWGL
jgi:hypothetical protein